MPSTLVRVQVLIRVRGRVGPIVASAFEDDFEVRAETVLCGRVQDDAAVRGVLDRIQDFGLSVIDVHVSSTLDDPGAGGSPFRRDGSSPTTP